MLHRNRKRFLRGVAHGSPVPLGKPGPKGGASKAEMQSRVNAFGEDFRGLMDKHLSDILFGQAPDPATRAMVARVVDTTMQALITELGVSKEVFTGLVGAADPRWLRKVYTLDVTTLAIPREQMDPAEGEDFSVMAVLSDPDRGYEAYTIPGVTKIPDRIIVAEPVPVPRPVARYSGTVHRLGCGFTVYVKLDGEDRIVYAGLDKGLLDQGLRLVPGTRVNLTDEPIPGLADYQIIAVVKDATLCPHCGGVDREALAHNYNCPIRVGFFGGDPAWDRAQEHARDGKTFVWHASTGTWMPEVSVPYCPGCGRLDGQHAFECPSRAHGAARAVDTIRSNGVAINIPGDVTATEGRVVMDVERIAEVDFR
jgi:hypothetical protein